MSDNLDKFGNAVANISDAFKTVKRLGENSQDLNRAIELARMYASDVQKLHLSDEPLLNDLKQELRKMLDSIPMVELRCKNVADRIENLRRFVNVKFTGSTIPTEVIKEFDEELKQAFNVAEDFLDPFEIFVGHLSDSQLLAVKLVEKLKQQSEELQKAADRSRNIGIAGTVGLTAVGAALAILGFFTGGVAWAAAGAVAGAAAGVGATALASKSYIDVKAMRQQAKDIKVCSDRLNDIVKELEGCIDKAIILDVETTTVLQNLSELFWKDLEKDERIAQLQAESRAKDEEIARLKEMLKQSGKE